VHDGARRVRAAIDQTTRSGSVARLGAGHVAMSSLAVSNRRTSMPRSASRRASLSTTPFSPLGWALR